MKRKDFDQLIDRGAFRDLFVTEMGWNNPDNSQSILITIDEQDFEFVPVADKQGFHVYTCETDELPATTDCKKLDNKLRSYGYDYICIFVQRGTSHHLWLTPVKTNEKRELVKTEYIGGAKADFLFSKIDDLSFELTEQVLITDVKNRVQGSFHLNSEKVTKDFYAQFRKEHKAFATHIVGFNNDKDRDWYTSVMLNRLMFCYFIQKKGFLDMNANYLKEKLNWVKEKQGEDQFFGTFYKGFLCSLFHDGLNSPRHDSEAFLAKYGRIPYLNGGMFDDHQLERENQGIDIADVAFENLFNFFDKWNWHLDTRLTASGKDINPDVLGYIFEQYINDRAAMGAYYTKEDITEYIGKNCIIPFLMDKTEEKSKDEFKTNGAIWELLRQSGDTYVYDAVKKGYSPDWQDRIPDFISRGIELHPEQHDLLERRSRWNEKSYDEFALPTEIWRETIERLQRCDSLLAKIANGEIHHINDFITYNLDIRRFAEDVIRTTNNHLLVAHFYQALQGVTILDPTCGSGAFLFAALNILEPLYEACLDRMEEFHSANGNLFKNELEEINAKYSSNRQYFIYKSIILRNLYGVDIMVEATEIAKLRLFLKMVAVVEVDKRKDNLGLDPLPDIDFNIKCGNTLVGYATEKELEKTLCQVNMFAHDEFKEKIDTELAVVAKAYECFRSEQLRTYDDNASIKATKEMLKDRLSTLNDLLNHHMHKTITEGDYNEWLKSHQPFHWLAEFYQIIHGNGGFDVIIGNPPYVEYNKKDSKTHSAISDVYKIRDYKTEECGNLYAFVIERCFILSKQSTVVGYIIPSASLCTPRMNVLSEILKTKGFLWSSIWDERPSKLFDGVDQQLCIHICQININRQLYITKMNHWTSDCRELIFRNIKYQDYGFKDVVAGVTPKIQDKIESGILQKLDKNGVLLSTCTFKSGVPIYYKNAGGRYWRLIKSFPTYFKSTASNSTTTEKKLFTIAEYQKLIVASLASSTFYWFWRVASNCRHLTNREMDAFPLAKTLIDKCSELDKVCDKYERSLLDHKKTTTTISRTSGEITQDFYFMKLSKDIIDVIDSLLAQHYGFTEEELDFIINYDIKYRMGDELSTEE